jgi:hypothetical protein
MTAISFIWNRITGTTWGFRWQYRLQRWRRAWRYAAEHHDCRCAAKMLRGSGRSKPSTPRVC